MKLRYLATRRGFTIVELVIVIAVIGILAAITIVAYTSIQGQARDSQRLNDTATLMKKIEVYRSFNRQLPPRSGSAPSWASSISNPTDYISGLDTDKLPLDPKNTGNYYYRYYVYSAGSYSCDVTRGDFYVLQVMTMEASQNPHPKSPGFSCSGRNWNGEAYWTTGGYTL